MARTFANGVTDYLGKSSPATLDNTGTIWFRFKPNWSSGDGGQHCLFDYFNNTSDLLHYVRFTNALIYVGRDPGGRVSGVSETGIFNAGVWATHQYSWDTASGAEFWVDNASKGTSSGSFTMGGFDNVVIGCGLSSFHGVAADGDIAEWARWNRWLTASERAILEVTGCPLFVPNGLVRYYPIIGRNSPETDLAGGENMTVGGTPAAATHPRVFLPYPGESHFSLSLTAYTLTGDAGAFTLTGVAAGLLAARKITGDAATFTLTGIAAGLLAARKITSAAGSFILSGIDATLNKGITLTAAAGSFIETGIDATLRIARAITGAVGSFILTGNAAGLEASGNVYAPGLALTVSDGAVLTLTISASLATGESI